MTPIPAARTAKFVIAAIRAEATIARVRAAIWTSDLHDDNGDPVVSREALLAALADTPPVDNLPHPDQKGGTPTTP